MNITNDVVKKIAASAHLHLSDEEVKKLLPQLKEILETFSQLDTIKTDGVQPSFHPIEIKNVTRNDTVGTCLNRDDALSLTQHKRGVYFRGPKTL